MLNRLLPRIILTLSSASILYWFRIYFGDYPIPSVDLPSYIQRAAQIREQLLFGRIAFYDPFTFMGYPVFHFYGFLTALITVVLSYLCDLIAANPMRLAAHLTLLFGCAALPWSMYFLARSLTHRIIEGCESILALSCAGTAFWFLNHDYQYFGVGAAAVMNIGLVAQLFGWHLLLLYLGCIARIVSKDSKQAINYLAIIVAALMLTHLMTAAYAFFMGGFAILWFSRERVALIKAHLLGAGLGAFWLIPFGALVGEYTAFDPAAPEGDPIRIFFRYPIAQIFKSIPHWITGHGSLISLTEPMFIAATITILLSHRLRSSPLGAFILFNLFGMILLTSSFVLTSLGFPFHYYRFNGYTVLTLAAFLAPIPAYWYLTLKAKGWAILPIKALVPAVLLLSLVITWALPHYEREMIEKLTNSEGYLEDEERVLDYFASLPEKGRVYFESLRNYKRYTPLSANYMNSFLYQRTGFESAVNAHLQEALGYRMLTVSAKLLKARTYNVPLLFSDRAQLSTKTKIDQLRQFGITHVVGDTPEFIEQLAEHSPLPVKKFGNYQIVQIGETPLKQITAVNKKLIGYVDFSGNLPFRFLEYFLYAREQLYGEFELVSLDPKLPLPESIHTIIINASSKNLKAQGFKSRLGAREFLQLRYKGRSTVKHYETNYSKNPELDSFNRVERYLEKNFDLARSLLALKTPIPLEVSTPPKLYWDKDAQGFRLENLVPGQFYRINYSYLPFWKADQGVIFRGSMERIFFQASAPQATFHYSRSNHWSWWLGLVVSCLSLLLWLRARSRIRCLLAQHLPDKSLVTQE